MRFIIITNSQNWGLIMLSNKTIVIGVTGGIAAYKAAELVSKLKKLHAEVHVIMTDNAKEFITPLTLQTLSQNKVITNMFEKITDWEIEHISLAQKADLFIIAPATANIIGKIANGIADDMLTTTIMAAKAPVLIASAMNTNMYENQIVQSNISKLKKLGYYFIDPDTGMLACGQEGKGRLADIDDIIEKACRVILFKPDLAGKTVLVTAGPTREYFDPVRFITNSSSGKMGYSIAKVAASRGANVILISGPVNLKKPHGVELIKVISADQMYEEVFKRYECADVIIKSAAVSDFKPKQYFESKIKKKNNLPIEMEKNIDILSHLGSKKGNRILVGFSMETEKLEESSINKLKEKNLDMIVANDLKQEGAGFQVDTNIVKIINKFGIVKDYPMMSKERVANVILDEVLNLEKSSFSEQNKI